MNRCGGHTERTATRGRRWAFRLGAVLLGLSPVIALESSLRSVGWQPVIPTGDPFVEFESSRPLFVEDEQGTTMVTAANRLEYFRPEAFPKTKPPNAFRIVCVGGSTVQGRPYAIETSFTSWLELSLQAADPTRQWEVINCGGVSYASYRLVPIVEEMLLYEPNFIVLYTGHNEFLEDRHYRDLVDTSTVVTQSLRGLNQLKSIQLAAQWMPRGMGWGNQFKDKQTLATEVDTLLDYQGGLQSYQRDPQWRHAVVAHFQYNLRRIVQLAGAANVPILLVDPPVNLRDCPPFKSVPTDGLSTDQTAQIEQLVSEAVELDQGHRERSIELLKQAVTMDAGNAANHFLLATLYDHAQRFDEAKHHYERSLDEDICPLRIISSLRDVIRDVANETGTPVVDVKRQFEELSEGAIPGRRLFIDHVHPTFHGHQLIAESLIEALQTQAVVPAAAGWKAKRDALYERRWRSLDLLYFERGKQRLEGLRLWSQGRAKKIRHPTNGQ